MMATTRSYFRVISSGFSAVNNEPVSTVTNALVTNEQCYANCFNRLTTFLAKFCEIIIL